MPSMPQRGAPPSDFIMFHVEDTAPSYFTENKKCTVRTELETAEYDGC